MLRRKGAKLLSLLFGAKNSALLSSAKPIDVSHNEEEYDNSTDEEKWENLQGMLISVKRSHLRNVMADKPLLLGRVMERIGWTKYRVKFFKPEQAFESTASKLESSTSRDSTNGVVEPSKEETVMPALYNIGTRARLLYDASQKDDPMALEGFILKVNGNGTYTMLMENDEIELSVLPENVIAVAPPTKVLYNPKFTELIGWLRSVIADIRDCEAVAFILFHRGWRLERLYLLEKADLMQMAFVGKQERTAIMEKAQWERDHHNVVRLLHRERVKDRDFRYALSKYKGTISCIAGICVVSYVFTANLRAYRSHQRGYQLKVAAKAFAHGSASPSSSSSSSSSLPFTHETASGKRDSARHVNRAEEEEKVCHIIEQLDTAHPRIVVLTGFSGSGKSAICRAAIRKEGVPAVFVDVHGSEDTLRSVVKSIGVTNIEVCGDLMDFVAEALQMASHGGRIPIIVIKLREGSSLERVYKEAVGLVSDHRACHLLLEVPLETLTPTSIALPRLDFYTIANFTRKEAFAYTEHVIDPLDLVYFTDIVGTNSNDLDELYASVRQRNVDVVAYTSLKLMKAMRQLQRALEWDSNATEAIKQLASRPFESGLPDDMVEHLPSLQKLAAHDIVLYDPVQDRWLFTQNVLHSAARCCRL